MVWLSAKAPALPPPLPLGVGVEGGVVARGLHGVQPPDGPPPVPQRRVRPDRDVVRRTRGTPPPMMGLWSRGGGQGQGALGARGITLDCLTARVGGSPACWLAPYRTNSTPLQHHNPTYPPREVVT